LQPEKTKFSLTTISNKVELFIQKKVPFYSFRVYISKLKSVQTDCDEDIAQSTHW